MIIHNVREVKDIISRYNANESINKLSQEYRVSFSVIKKCLLKTNVIIRRVTKKYVFDEHYFSIMYLDNICRDMSVLNVYSMEYITQEV